MAIAKLGVWVLINTQTNQAMGYPSRTLPDDYANISGLKFMSPEDLADLSDKGLSGLGFVDYAEAKAMDVRFQPDVLFQFASSVRAEIDTFRSKKIKAGYKHNFGGQIGEKTFQTEQDDQINWLGVMAAAQALLALGNTEQDLYLRAKDNSIVTLKPLQTIQFLLSMQAYVSSVFAESWATKTAVEQATSVEQIQAIMNSLS